MANGSNLHMVGFSVGKEEFSIDILKVQDIIRMMEITKIPNTPEFVEGVINLRGKVISINGFGKRCSIYCEAQRDWSHGRLVAVAIGEKTGGIELAA